MANKKINYKELAESYEKLLDAKNKELKNLYEILDDIKAVLNEDIEDRAHLSRKILNLKIDRLGLSFLLIVTLICLFIK